MYCLENKHFFDFRTSEAFYTPAYQEVNKTSLPKATVGLNKILRRLLRTQNKWKDRETRVLESKA